MPPPWGETQTGIFSEERSADPYFESYSDTAVHELMLRDTVRTQTYRDAIEKNAAMFKDKVVMDVGAGVGILSLFCARAGARRVYAVEASGVAELAIRVVEKNKLQDVIEVIPKKVEEIKELDSEVDIIVSEWMGFYLLHESMLDSVLYARDKWLLPEGHVFPFFAYVFLAPIDASPHVAQTVDAWSDFHGFDLSPVGDAASARQLSRPAVLDVEEDALLAEPKMLASFDLKTVSPDDLVSIFESMDFEAEWTTSSTASRPFHGFACWFDCVFCAGVDGGIPVTLTTRPGTPSTHWKQTVFFLPERSSVAEGETISCYVTLTRCVENPRRYDVSIDLRSAGDENEDEDETDAGDHPVPCDCGATRCLLVKAVMERYDREDEERIEIDADSKL